jgi:hypothetical protein
MYEWTEPYADEYLKKQIEVAASTQKELPTNGQILCSTYEQLWLPALGDLPDVSYSGQERYNAPYGSFLPAPGRPFYGAMVFIPKPGMELPPALRGSKDWQAAVARLDLNERVLKIEAGDIAITFTGVNVNLKPHEMLQDINRELVRVEAGAYLWKVELAPDAASEIQHLYPDGNVPAFSNAHTRADVTGFAYYADRPYQHTLVYIGLAAHKTSVESLWASLIRGRAGASLRGTPVLADGDVRLISTPLPDFGVIHAGIACRKALPGQWEAGDDCAYALVFGKDPETELRRVTLKRLQETLAFPIPDEWGNVVWAFALDAGYIQRLEAGGDCRGGVRIDLTKDWQELVQGLIEQNLVIL